MAYLGIEIIIHKLITGISLSTCISLIIERIVRARLAWRRLRLLAALAMKTCKTIGAETVLAKEARFGGAESGAAKTWFQPTPHKLGTNYNKNAIRVIFCLTFFKTA